MGGRESGDYMLGNLECTCGLILTLWVSYFLALLDFGSLLCVRESGVDDAQADLECSQITCGLILSCACSIFFHCSTLGTCYWRGYQLINRRFVYTLITCTQF